MWKTLTDFKRRIFVMAKNKKNWDFIQAKMPELLDGKVFENLSDEDLESLVQQVKDKIKEVSAAEELINQACAAYGIDKKYVFMSRVDAGTGEALIVTNGGKKVRFKSGQKVEPLDEISITGINPTPKKKSVVATVSPLE
jgi:microcompartment protein CcmK/EutM